MAEFSDELLLQAKLEIMRAQVMRFKEFYAKYFAQDETRDLVNFFFEKIYNLESQGAIIKTAINTFGKIKDKLPKEIRKSIQDVIDLNDFTNSMDEGMAEVLLQRGWKPGTKINTTELAAVYKAYGHREERVKQLTVMLDTFEFSHQLAHSSLGKVLLGPARLAARIFRVMPLFEFLEEGYIATRMVGVDLFKEFVEELTATEWKFLHDNLGK